MNDGATLPTTTHYAQYALIVSIALVCSCLNFYHVSTMFENDRHFSHLSTLEREMTFRSEMGFYYSYYKRIVNAPSFFLGLHSIMNDNKTEYPSTINTLQRFNLYPEVILGAAYRGFIHFTNTAGIKTKECWQVDRGDDLPAVWSCEGLGDPSYFYINGVWLCAGITAALIFLYGCYLSRSIFGGIIAISAFFFNHVECTRVQWTPPLRESFGYPLILAQILSVSWCLRQTTPHWKHLCCIAFTTTASLVTWQFSQFVFLTQVLSLTVLWIQNSTPRSNITVVFLGKLIGLQNAIVLLFANEMLLTSYYSCSIVVLLGFIVFFPHFSSRPQNEWLKLRNTVIYGVLIGACTFFLRLCVSILIGSKDDAHILNLLRSKFTSFRDFHTMLYTCAAEFDFISLSTIYRLSSTLLLPIVYIAVGSVTLYAAGIGEMTSNSGACQKRTVASLPMKKQRESRRDLKEIPKSEIPSPRKVDAAVQYNILQLIAFIIMAAIIMRLKLFMSPHLCIMASLVASKKYMFFVKGKLMHLALLAALLSGMSYAGLRNLKEQRSIVGEYSNPALEDLVNWIQKETPREEAAFAGPMPIMASILLTTQRPIINHPHYEYADLRERTKIVYRAFGRGTVAELYRSLVDLKVTYFVLQDHWCYGESRPGCSMLNIWDIEEPHRKDLNPLCSILFEGNPSPLQRVFSNEIYVVLRVPSRYVEVKLPPRQYRQ
ncbi:probable C-mannosyltransferase DPY19L1 [Daphnia pulex]|uniref:probable C-mannosyltransferase DPY19L1 n=1 Tax=Daphnia pulex TaxID=6669 RepID=UPI001EE0F9FE|nr:probable C-mannosyltransferase DPY19L1 [Daphnia pulex]